MGKPILLKSRTVSEAVPEIASELQKHPLSYGQGMETAVDEAAYLVSFVAELPPDFNEQDANCQLNAKALARLQSILSERIHSNVPLAYLLGETWQMGAKFYVDKHVLIPRSPIAQMIAEGFFPWLPDTYDVERVLDLCTGSGCLGILTALEFPNACVDASDIDQQALQIAKRNIDLHGLKNRVNTILSDVYEQLPGNQYDIIIANPPYVPITEKSDLPYEFSHEPEHALFAGENGLGIAKRILIGASKYLLPQGLLVLEVGQSAKALQRSFPKHDFIWQELEYGGEGVCILTGDECKDIAHHNI